MISYIFKNKTKNILAIVFTVLYVLNTNLMYWLYSSINFGEFLLLSEVVLKLLPYIFIIVYLCTLKRQYRFKEWLFPAAFAIFVVVDVHTIIVSIITNIEYINSVEGFIWLTSSVAYDMVLLAAYILCLLGSIKNFKNVILLRVGLIILMISIVINQAFQFLLSNMGYDLHNAFLNYLNLLIPSIAEVLYDAFILLLFYFGLLNLTFNKKSEYIDITPYVEERKAKKEAKRAAKLEAKQQEEAYLNEPTPEIPDGSWRCMACGKILPDSIDRCECGYKK